ncbi:ATP-binding Cassette superfamily [Thecamonas trahens ATCC 50062]|uniref:ATP-binding Cassette superfamily n=1 Tax=Thecamonas trahens ATCC 50062 TaxID=461836 RepID=A0A0L0D4Z7_THETB|nr:ATP-binding Cassette superfamily [Thecamonas trahens ATCC 50062]KNC47320.1 ATP-binding Cassette superfamily [Thecamonas trahens ATCC 50062]|eukprot:XP_013759658.1 ATP-binding Cassette superfamily [Thecamonas trahens ATCC 50062]
MSSTTSSASSRDARGPAARICFQTLTLLRKNGRTYLRSPGSIATFVALPAAVLIVLGLLALISQSNSDLATANRTPSRTLVGAIPACTASVTGAPCNRFAYNYAGVPVVDRLIGAILGAQGIPASDVVGLAGDADAVEAYMLANYNTTQAAYIFDFDNVTHANALPTTGPFYTLMANLSIYEDACSETSVSDRFYNCPQPASHLVLPMQKALHEATVAELGLAATPASFDVAYVQFAHPVIIESDLRASAVVLFLVIAACIPLVMITNALVGEKEARLKHMLDVVGVSSLAQFVSWWMTLTLLTLLSVVVLMIALAVFQFPIVVRNDPALLFVLLLIHAFALVSTGFALAAPFNAVKPARTVGQIYIALFAISASAIALVLELDNDVAKQWRPILNFVPPAMLAKGINDLATAAMQRSTTSGLSWADRTSNATYYPLADVYGWLVLDTFLYLILAWFLANVTPDVIGARRPPWFFLTREYWGCGASTRVDSRSLEPPSLDSDADSDVERLAGTIVHEPAPGSLHAIGISRVFRSMYETLTCASGFTAVHSVSLELRPNRCFALLGPNGSGKSTTINMLTGALAATSGIVALDGVVLSEASLVSIRRALGVAPQFDVVWDHLSAAENVAFFARLKGVPESAVADEVEERLTEVELWDHASRPVGGFSGGMRRRLSVAMALTGSPQVVLLDEPSSGLDPVSRRKLWDVIQRASLVPGRIVLLTTHSMEEADVLADDVAILVNGHLRALGSPLHLKTKFGEGYRVKIACRSSDRATLLADLTAAWPKFVPRADGDQNIILVVSARARGKLLRLLEDLEARDEVHDVALSLTTLDDVFLDIAGKYLDPDQLPDATPLDAMSDASGTESSGNESSTGSRSKSSSRSLSRRKTGSVANQAVALGAKTWHLMRRQRSQLCCQILFPAVILGILVLIQVLLVSSSDSLSDVDLDPKPFSPANLFTVLASPGTWPHRLGTVFAPTTSYGSRVARSMQGIAANASFNPFNSVPLVAAGFKVETWPSYAALQADAFASWEVPAAQYLGGIVYNSLDLSSGSMSVDLLFNRTDENNYLSLIPLHTASFTWAVQGALNASAPLEVLVSSTPSRGVIDSGFSLMSILALLLYPLLLFIQFPMYVANVVYDKERNLIAMMKIMGLKTSVYWAINLAINSLLYTAGVVLLIVLGLIADIDFFTANAAGAYIILFLLFGFAMIGFAAAFSTLFAKEQVASVAAYGLVWLSWLTGLILLGQIGSDDGKLRLFSLHPYYALLRGVVNLAAAAENGGIRMAQLDEFKLDEIYGFLAGEGVVLWILALWLDAVYPAGDGVRKPWFFFLQPSYWRTHRVAHSDEERSMSVSSVSDLAASDEDSDVAAERMAMVSASAFDDNAIILRSLRKRFGSFDAVRGVSFGVRRNEVLALLGPSGAGKTTVVNMLAGHHAPSSGTAYVDSLNVATQIDDIHAVLGVCPQHDVHWGMLTASEHLTFYGRLKGLSGSALATEVRETLEALQLAHVANKAVGSFSGGMRRRVSLGMAIIGSPRIVMLDEPTTGLDPVTRRGIWRIIRTACARRGATVVLTTHSMEEAEALADRVAIMTGGTLACIGTTAELKAKFASGYRVTVALTPDGKPVRARAAIERALPSAVWMAHSLGSVLHFAVPGDELQLSQVFEAAQEAEASASRHIAHFAVAQSTLEDVFINRAVAANGSSPATAATSRRQPGPSSPPSSASNSTSTSESTLSPSSGGSKASTATTSSGSEAEEEEYYSYTEEWYSYSYNK